MQGYRHRCQAVPAVVRGVSDSHAENVWLLEEGSFCPFELTFFLTKKRDMAGYRNAWKHITPDTPPTLSPAPKPSGSLRSATSQTRRQSPAIPSPGSSTTR